MSVITSTIDRIVSGSAWLSNELGLTGTVAWFEKQTGLDGTVIEVSLAAVVFAAAVWLTSLVSAKCWRGCYNFVSTRIKRLEKNDKAVEVKELPLSEAIRDVRSGFYTVGYFSFFINLLLLVTPIYMLQIYDRVLTSGSHATLLYLSVLAVALIAINGVLELSRSHLLVRIGTRLDVFLNGPVYRSLFSEQSLANRQGVQQLTDLGKVRNFLGSSGLNAFFDAPWTPIFILLIFALHPLLGIIATVGAVILLTLAIISELITRNVFTDASSKAHEAVSMANANIRNAEVIKGMGMLNRVTEIWQHKNYESLVLQSAGNERIGLLTAIAKTVRPCLQIAMLGAGAFLALEGVISAGVMIAASIILGRALAPVEAAVSQWRTFVAARLSYDRLKEAVYDTEVEANRLSHPRPTGALSVEDVTLTPPLAPEPVLRDLSFVLEPGEILAVIGPSAAGKSTLARALVNIWIPDHGSIRLDGVDLSQWRPDELGDYIGYLPQDVELFEGTVAENITRFSQLDSNKILEAARLANAHEMILRLPNGFETDIGPNGSVLSGGQRQRIGLARALYGRPALVVLDEPDASLDTEGEQALMETLNTLRENVQTAIVISHRPGILQAVDKVMVLRGGRIEAIDSSENLLPKLIGKPRTDKNVRSARQKKVILNKQG
ncbi:MAG: type I secretion system permease/ATPase [Pseudomonadota bacterium]